MLKAQKHQTSGVTAPTTTKDSAASAIACLEKPYLQSFAALKSELRRRGYFRKDPTGVLGILAFHSLMFLFGLSVFVWHDAWLVMALATVIWGYGLTGIAANTHSASHYATSNARWLNRLLTYVGYPVITGFSASYWWHKHIVLHHRHPNLIDHDVDIEWMPMFALTEMDYQRSGVWAKFYYRWQGIFVPFALALNMTYGQWHSLRFIVTKCSHASTRKSGHLVDAICLVLHFSIWLILPLLVFSPWSVVGFYCLRNVILGYTFFLLNAPSHYPEEAICLAQPEQEDFVLRQTATTLNYRVGWLGRMLCSGVEFQIEHHLFPAICHTRLPAISPLVKEYCDFHGYPYRTLGWGNALRQSILAFYIPKRIQDPLYGKRQ